MKLRQNNSKGYSIVEIIIATVLVISLSGVSYKVLKTLTLKQSTNVAGQKTNKAAQIALDRFKNDLSMVDYNWVRYGIASIYPHPGYGFGLNYYVDQSIQNKESLNDGVTFLRRDPSTDKIYEIDEHKRLCYPAAETVQDLDLYNNTLKMISTDGLHEDDWVLVYQAGKYALAMVQKVDNDDVIIVEPQSTTQQRVSMDNSSVATGFVSRAGIVPANIDFHADLTSLSSDDAFCFDINAARIQKIGNPVSYFVDYRTTDGEEKSAGNSYVLDRNGNLEKMLVRVEYHKASTKREYLALIDQVEFYYDLLTSDPTIIGGVNRDVGHEKNNDKMLKILSNTDPVQSDLEFESTAKIVAVKMNLRLANEGKETTLGEKDWKQAQEIKIALDPSFQENMYRDVAEISSTVTQNLNTIPITKGGTSTYNQQLGRPLYVSNGAGQEIMVPVSTFEIQQNGSMGSDSSGQIYVYDADQDPGCAVNGSGKSCDPKLNNSVINFTLPTGKTFFPNTINQITLANGVTRIIVGGVGMDATNGVIARQSVLATIELAAGQTLADKLMSGGGNGSCNIADCSIQVIDNTQQGLEDFVDTANITVDANEGDIYVTTMTKKVGENSPSSIYKGEWNGTEYSYSKYAEVPNSNQGRIVSAVADRMVEAGGGKYIALCLTKKINCNGGECLNDQNGGIPGEGDTETSDVMGRIELIKNANEKIVLMKQNWACSSLNVDNNNNLIVTGRLHSEFVSHEEIKNSITNSDYLAEIQKKILYMDEVGRVQGGVSYYADYFKVDEKTYDTSNTRYKKPQDIGWMTGLSSLQFPDGTFGVVNANKYRLAPGASSAATTNYSSAVKEYSNAGIMKVNLAGMSDRVVATIETNQANVNNSKVTATYNGSINEYPPTYIPGQFYSNSISGASRTTPTPLPSASPAMSDESWIELYRHMISPTSNLGLNSDMPTIGVDENNTKFKCKYSYPKCTVMD